MDDYNKDFNVAVPVTQTMDATSILTGERGCVIRKVAQLSEVAAQQLLGLPIEKANKYKVAFLTPTQHALKYKGDPEGYKPTQSQLNQFVPDLFAYEESDFSQRFLLGCLGCMNLRPLTMPFVLQKPPNQNVVAFQVQRPFQIGAACCCPHTSYAQYATGETVGSVVEDCECGRNYCLRCAQICFCCTSYYTLNGVSNSVLTPKYELPLNLCCCGRHNNFCSATPCVNDALWDIIELEPKTGRKLEVVGKFQKTYGGGECSCEALFRCCFKYNNYVIEWKPGMSAEDKILFLAAFVNTEYVYFENTGGDN